MTSEVQDLPHPMRSVRLGIGAMAVAIVSALLTACAGTDGGLVTEDTTLKQPVKVSAAEAATTRPTTAEAHKAKASKAKTSPAKASPAKVAPVRKPTSTTVVATTQATTRRLGTAKASPPRVETQGPASSSMTTAALGKERADTVVDLPYRPAVGSRWIGVTEMRETKTKAGRVVESMVLRDRGEYRVVQKLENGYRVSYTLRDGSIDGNSPLTELMKPVVQSMKGQSFAYETDETGAPTRILDVDRLKALAVKAIDILAQSKPEFTSVPQLKQFLDGIRSQFDAATPETGVALFLEPVIRYSMVQGLTNFPIGEERSYDDEVVNPLVGAKMRARGSFKVASVDRVTGLATVEWKLAVLPEDLNKATRDLVMRFVPEGADTKKLNEAMAQMKPEHLERATYKVALADGVVRRMDRTAVVKMHDVEKTSVTIMTLSPVR